MPTSTGYRSWQPIHNNALKQKLENRNTNITMYLASITNAFSDFRLVAQIREEIEKVKQVEVLAMIPTV